MRTAAQVIEATPVGPDPSAGRPPWLLILWGLALVITLTSLGNVPLRDWDEAIAARVALELSRAPGGPQLLLPTIWSDPYLNKPPGLHLLIAAAIRIWRTLSGADSQALPPDGLIRLVPALLSTLVVPLGGLIQRQLRPGDRWSPALCATVLLTLLPIIRHGRLAMLDGSQLSAIALLWLGLLRARSGGTALMGWGILSGLAGSALLLLKAPMLVPALAAGLLALRLDPAARGLPWGRLLLVGLLGLLPGLGWHLFHLGMRGSDALHLWLGDGAVRVLTDAGEGSSEGWRVPVLEMLEGGWPWLLFWPFGVALAWRLRRRSEGCWPLVLQTVMALSILPLRTQLPWYSHPLWLPAALLITPVLAWLVGLEPRPSEHRPPASALLVRIPDVLTLLGALLTLAGLGAWSGLRPYSPFLLVIGTGWLTGGLILRPDNRSRRGMGLVSIAAGNGLALLLLMQSHLWNWELAERWPVGPVAAMVEREAPAQVWIWRESSRPSLNWYARREIRRLRRGTAWEPGTTRWILSRPEDSADLPGRCQPLEQAGEWQLMRCRG